MQHPNANVERDDFLTLNQLVTHAGLSKRTLEKYLHHPLTPLPHHKIGNKILVTVSEYRAWADQFKRTAAVIDVRAIVSEVGGR